MKKTFFWMVYFVALGTAMLAALFLSGFSTLMITEHGFGDSVMHGYVAIADILLVITLVHLFLVSLQVALSITEVSMGAPKSTVRNYYVSYLIRTNRKDMIRFFDTLYEVLTIGSQVWFVFICLATFSGVFGSNAETGAMSTILGQVAELPEATTIYVIMSIIILTIFSTVWFFLFPCSKRSGELLTDVSNESEPVKGSISA